MMDSIEQLRQQIDQLDETIVKALLERLAVSQTIGLYKEHETLPITDLSREQMILERILKLCSSEVEEAMMVQIYTAIFAYSKKVQKRKSDE